MVRCVLGKRGDVTQRLRRETGANIRVLAVLRTLVNWSSIVECRSSKKDGSSLAVCTLLMSS